METNLFFLEENDNSFLKENGPAREFHLSLNDRCSLAT